MIPTIRGVIRLFVFFSLAVLFSFVGAQPSAPETRAGHGFVESITLDPDNQRLTVTGWVAPQNSNVFVTNLILEAHGIEIYRGRFERLDRPDVAQIHLRKDWLLSGFRIVVNMPRGIPNGVLPLKASARLGSGEVFELPLYKTVKSAVLSRPDAPSNWRIWALLASVVLPLLIVAGSFLPQVSPRASAVAFGAGLLLAFSLLTAGGWTGSSLGLALKASPVVVSDGSPWMGQDQWVRSDEWEVLTPLAISQVSHSPRFPIVNKLMGADGQNMMIIGMTGVPIAHLSSVAKPATWGFFAFDLRSALAWYWWFPFFACFAALWVALIQMFGLDWRQAAALSLIGSASPYAVVYSGWPAYTVFFPLVALLAFLQLFRQRTIWWASLFGLGLGWAIAGFALVLYPSWQISLAYLIAPVAIAWVWIERKQLCWGLPQVVALSLATVVTVILLGSWWQDARDAVAAIQSTVYPGGRSLEAGGDIDPWFLLKGWLGPTTVYNSSDLMVPSDAGSFIFLLWVAIPAALIRAFSLRRVDPLGCTLVAVILLILMFQFIGFDQRISQLTLLGKTTVYRMDLVLGLAQIFLFGWLMSPARAPQGEVSRVWKALCFGLTMASLLYTYWVVEQIPFAIAQTLSPALMLLMFGAIAVASYGLLTQRYRWVLCVCLVWTLSTSLPFNPISQATTRLTPSPKLLKEVSQIDPKNASPTIAVVGERAWAMTLPAAGLHIVNTAFYYPQTSIWATLDPKNDYATVHNRYHRLLLGLKTLSPGTSYVLENPRLDEVRVSLDPNQFDFRLLGAKAVLLNPTDGQKLRNNAGLALVGATEQWELFRVLD